ncbi:MAG: hypothetical protein WCJ39_00630 [bacterium]
MMDTTKTCYLTTHRKLIGAGVIILILGIALGALMGHGGDRGERFERGRFPMQGNQEFRGQMMGGQRENCALQNASGQVAPAQQVKQQQVQAPTQVTK